MLEQSLQPTYNDLLPQTQSGSLFPSYAQDYEHHQTNTHSQLFVDPQTPLPDFGMAQLGTSLGYLPIVFDAPLEYIDQKDLEIVFIQPLQMTALLTLPVKKAPQIFKIRTFDTSDITTQKGSKQADATRKMTNSKCSAMLHSDL